MRRQALAADMDGRLRNVAIAGASGRMGQRLLTLAEKVGICVTGAWVAPTSALLGQATPVAAIAYGGVGAATALPGVVIDFSAPAGFDAILAWCRQAGAALVSGTTGLSESQHDAMNEAAVVIPVLWSANFSPGVAVLKRVAAQAARALADWDLEIFEAHHAGKRDAPSGTALALGEAVAQARGQLLAESAVTGRQGMGQARAPGAIGFASIRASDIVGEHTVFIAGPGERLELSHRATDRDIFARGALLAARWLAGRAPGLYRFEDVFEPAGD